MFTRAILGAFLIAIAIYSFAIIGVVGGLSWGSTILQLLISRGQPKNVVEKNVPIAWKTYLSPEHGFKIQYPDTWRVSIRPSVGDNCRGEITRFYLLRAAVAVQSFDIDVCDMLPGETAKQAFARIQEFTDDISVYEGTQRTIAGKSADTYENLPGLALWDAAYFVHKNKMYILISRVNNKNFDDRFHGSFQLLN